METLLAIPQNLLLGAIGLLDALPDGARASLAAVFLILFLRHFEAAIPSHEIQYGQSFRKTALVSLIFIPAFVWLVPASRMTVYVDELLPAEAGLHPVWLSLLAVWLTGVMVSLGALLRDQIRLSNERDEFNTIDDDKLTNRLAHWQRRLGIERTIELVEIPGTDPRFLTSARCISLPAAARHWPGNLQDVLLIVGLAHLKRRHRRWHRLGRVVTCLYWPVPWVQHLVDNLIRDFQQSADELAESCYRDRLGYDRALRQLAQRLEPPGPKTPPDTAEASPQKLPSRLKTGVVRYADALLKLLSPAIEPQWRLADLLTERSTDNKITWTDPYDRVVLFVGQAVFLAFLLTGTTLKERPPEIDYEYSFPFELLWKEHFHRNLELQEKVQPPPPS